MEGGMKCSSYVKPIGTSYTYFKMKCVNKRDLRIGEQSVNNCGRRMKIIKYRSNKDIDIKFEDGYIKEHVNYQHFKNGKVRHKDDRLPQHYKSLSEEEKNNRIGQRNINKQGYEMKITKYVDAQNIDVQFLIDNEIREHCSYYHFLHGSILHPKMRRKSYNLGNIVGKKYGKLTAIKYYGWERKRGHIYECRCDCGEKTYATEAELESGRRKSCGCLVAPLPNDMGIVNRIIESYKKGAEIRGYDWNLSTDDVVNLIHEPCYYCGIVDYNEKRVKRTRYEKVGYKYNGIDRVDNDKGYSRDNVVPCCKLCNQAKMNLEQGEFYSWIKRVSIHLSDELKTL